MLTLKRAAKSSISSSMWPLSISHSPILPGLACCNGQFGSAQQRVQTLSRPGFPGKRPLAQLQLMELPSATCAWTVVAQHACGHQQRKAHHQQHGEQCARLCCPLRITRPPAAESRGEAANRPAENCISRAWGIPVGRFAARPIDAPAQVAVVQPPAQIAHVREQFLFLQFAAFKPWPAPKHTVFQLVTDVRSSLRWLAQRLRRCGALTVELVGGKAPAREAWPRCAGAMHRA